MRLKILLQMFDLLAVGSFWLQAAAGYDRLILRLLGALRAFRLINALVSGTRDGWLLVHTVTNSAPALLLCYTFMVGEQRSNSVVP